MKHNELLFQADFKHSNVKVYDNRIELKQKGIGNLFSKGLSGTFMIYLKQITAIEFSNAYIEFMTASNTHVQRTLNKVNSDFNIEFNKKEFELATKLIEVINNLID